MRRKIPNTFGLDVTSANFLEYESEQELRELIEAGRITRPFLHVGSGSNLLFTKDYEGTILHSRITGIEVTAESESFVEVRVGAGVIWDDFVDYCVEHDWYGAENLSLIPGEVGASAVQNIGAYGVEVKDLITSVETIDLCCKKRIFSFEECAYAYRKSIFKSPEMKSFFVTYVNFRLSKKEYYTLDYNAIRQRIADEPEVNLSTLRRLIIDIRKDKLPDPAHLGNAGSFFMNPVISRECFDRLRRQYPSVPYYDVDAEQVKVPAGWLIEQCGWKGRSLGPVAVYDRQALVLVNLGGATGADVVALADAIKEAVYKKFEIEIFPEVNFI